MALPIVSPALCFLDTKRSFDYGPINLIGFSSHSGILYAVNDLNHFSSRFFCRIHASRNRSHD